MSGLNDLNKVEIPNISDILKSGKKAKGQFENIKLNKVNVHFFHSDGRFKRTVEGTLSYITELPIVFIEYPNKLGYLVLEDSLIFDVTNQSFELFVNENYTHTISLKTLVNIDMDKKIKELIENTNFVLPVSPTDFKLKKVKINMPSKENIEGETIDLLPTFLSSLGRAKLLENTTETSNDGLIIVGFLGLLIGIIIGIIVTALVVL